MPTTAEVNEALERPISREDLEQRSMHYVEGHKSKADNPHWHRVGTYKEVPYGRSTVLALVKVSPDVAAWLKTFDDVTMSPEDEATAARLAALPEPEWLASVKAYRTHTQRMAEFYKALDKANTDKPPVEWHPICEIRAMWLKESTDWRDEKAREKSNAAARKRGDIIHTSAGADE